MARTYGYIKSTGNLNVQPFVSSPTLQGLASTNTNDTHIINDSTPVLDQSSLQSCVAHSCCEALEILYNNAHPGQFVQLSRLFLYFNARAASGITNQDAGCYIHLAYESLKTLGTCDESLWQYNINEVFAQPPILAYRQGNDNQITDFYQIITMDSDRLDDIELAVRANHPVSFGTNVGDELEGYNGDPNAVMNPPKVSKGGHAMLVVGVRTNSLGRKEFLVKNSWGKSWGLNGHAWFSSDYMVWNKTSDIFVPTIFNGLLT